MNLAYNFVAHIAYFFLKIYGAFNPKMKLFIKGRKETFQKLSVIQRTDKVIWFHAASLGEFEQARPIIEELKNVPLSGVEGKSYKIVVTFFSPSGYEIRKNYELADVICYLPFDTKSKVKRFINQIHPDLAVIVKYEFWPNLLNELKRQNTQTILVSGIFRKNQRFFKSSGSWMRKSLTAFDYFFVQNSTSKELLNSINFKNVQVTGDTRFDRVSKILEQDNSLDFIKEFKNNQYTVVAGSTWDEGEKLLVNYINQSKDEKFIIAPHNMNEKSIKKLKESITKKAVLFSAKENKNLSKYDVFIIDTIGLLTKIYSYADAVYVGGGFKTGLHNILEPATFGVPIVIGPEYSKFQEAIDLVDLKGCLSVKNQQEFTKVLKELKTDESFREETGKINQQYIKNNKGAKKKIMNYINNKLNK